VDLTNAIISLSVQDSQDPTQTILFNGSMSVDDAVAGECHYTVASGNFPNLGTFLAQITASWPNESITWSGITIIVTPKLPKSNN
jgi:hypothetical protein